jgi:hypothetical protein
MPRNDAGRRRCAIYMQRALGAECRKVAESRGEKGGELGAVHFARGHQERTVMDRTEPARVTVDTLVGTAVFRIEAEPAGHPKGSQLPNVIGETVRGGHAPG